MQADFYQWVLALDKSVFQRCEIGHKLFVSRNCERRLYTAGFCSSGDHRCDESSASKNSYHTCGSITFFWATVTTFKSLKKRLLRVLLSLDFLFIKVHKLPCQSITIDPFIINMPSWSSTSPPRSLHSPSSKVSTQNLAVNLHCFESFLNLFWIVVYLLIWLAFVEVLVTVQRRKTHSYVYWLLVAWCYIPSTRI